jgi:N-acetylglucosamine-6-phosphate deacetylase
MGRVAAQDVLLPSGWSGPASVRFDHGSITAIEPDASVGPDAPRWLVPGFVDLQVNGIGIDDVWALSAAHDDAGWNRLSRSLAAQGTTSWCPTLITAPLDRYATAIDWLRTRPAHGPRMLGVHLEGPFIGERSGAHDRAWIVPVDRSFLTSLPPTVKMITIAPEMDGALECIPGLVERGVVVALGHSAAGADDCRRAVDAGASAVTHLFNAMTGVTHRSPGLAALALDDRRLSASIIADGVHVDPMVARMAFRSAPGRIFLVTDSVATARPGGPMVGADGAPRLADGTLAGTALRMIDAVRRCVSDFDLAPETALAAASAVPAELIGADDRGVIEVGRLADFVELDDDFEIRATWIGGEQFWRRPDAA